MFSMCSSKLGKTQLGDGSEVMALSLVGLKVQWVPQVCLLCVVSLGAPRAGQSGGAQLATMSLSTEALLFP